LQSSARKVAHAGLKGLKQIAIGSSPGAASLERPGNTLLHCKTKKQVYRESFLCHLFPKYRCYLA